MIIKKYYKMVRVSYADSEYFRITNVDTIGGSIRFENMSGKNIEYSTDGVNWTILTIPSASAVTIDDVAPGMNVYLRGTNSTVGSSTYGKRITANFNHNIGGNICSLLDKTNFSTMTSISSQWALGKLFYQDTKLVNAGDVILGNVTSLGLNALSEAFYGCTSLTTAPDLGNVTSLGNNALIQMFYDCTSLTTAPDLGSVTSIESNAINNAFVNCTNLTTAPDLRNVTSLGTGSLVQAFSGCSKLQTIYVPNVDTWDTSKFSNWVNGAGTTAATPKQMIFQTQALLDACPSGNKGYGGYERVLA